MLCTVAGKKTLSSAEQLLIMFDGIFVTLPWISMRSNESHPSNWFSFNSVIPSGRIISRTEVPLTACAPKRVTVVGKFNSVNLTQFRNALLSIVCRPSGNFIDSNVVQSANALALMLVKLLGSLIAFNAVHPLNAEFPIVFNAFGKTTSWSLVHPSKHPAGICVNWLPVSNSTLVIPVHPAKVFSANEVILSGIITVPCTVGLK